ncbi:DNA primase [Desulfovermiculus halophilus]|uniref:DNA primase n=1 Tax=Desulfovermiculus halophilus TaxID=339722 RepID=UPI0005541C99|nr:DNA primase [Desulfovermiculus halophilus]
MSKVHPEQIQAIKDRIDFLDLIQRYVTLRRAGDRWMGVCPFHQESKPSMSVNPERGFFYCFGCHASGDVIDFYCRINGLEFMEGVQELAREAGIELSQESDAQAGLRRQCLEMHALAQDMYQRALAGEQGRAARAYLRERGFDQEIVQRFGLGWAPDSWNALKSHLIKNGFTPEQGVQGGLLSKNTTGRIYDRFRSRVMFPIQNLGGRTVAFGGRIVGQGEPKYLNSSESPVFTKGDFLYGLEQARRSMTQSRQALLTEGYADVLTMVQFGFPNSCGVLGTSLTASQVRRLAGLCSTVVLLFDGDRAGQQAALRSSEMILAAGLQVQVVCLPDGEDVDSLLRSQGKDALHKLMNEADEGLAFCLRMIRSNAAPKDIMDWAVGFLKSLNQAAWQAYYLPRLAEGLHLSEAELRTAVSSKQTSGRSRQGKTPRISSSESGQRDRELLAFAVRCPEYMPKLKAQGLAGLLRTSRGRALWDKLCAHGHDRVLPFLDEGEKAFFVSCQFQDHDPERDRQVWDDISNLLLRGREQSAKQRLKAAIAQAQARGDEQEVGRLLSAYSQFLKGAE